LQYWFKYYQDLLRENRAWLIKAAAAAFFWLAIGALTGAVRPDLLDKLLPILEDFFRDVLGEEGLRTDFETVWDIARNNFQSLVVMLFGGVVLGILPAIGLILNFFILGFLLSSMLAAEGASGLFVFAVTVVPHGILEIPALVLAAAFGIKLGLFWRRAEPGVLWKNFSRRLKENFMLLPAFFVFLLAAAVIEVFVTGALSAWLFE